MTITTSTGTSTPDKHGTRLFGRLAVATVSLAIPLTITTIDAASARTTHAARPAASVGIGVSGTVSSGGSHSGLELRGSLSGDTGTDPGEDASDGPGSDDSCDPSPAPSPDPSQSPTDAPSGPSSPAPTDSPSTSPADSAGGDDCGDTSDHGVSLIGARVRAAHAHVHVKAGLRASIKVTVATAKGKALAAGRAVLLEGKKQVSAAAVAAGKVIFKTAKLAQGTHRLHVALVSDTGNLVTTTATLVVTAA